MSITSDHFTVCKNQVSQKNDFNRPKTHQPPKSLRFVSFVLQKWNYFKAPAKQITQSDRDS